MSALSKEYISDSEDEEHTQTQEFQVPANYKKCKHLKSFPIPARHAKKSLGKQQLWLLKFPANVDLSKLKLIPMDVNSETELITDIPDLSDKKYRIAQDSASDSLNLLVPDDSKETLQYSDVKFDKIVTINEIVQIPNINLDHVKTDRKNVVKPQGLQMKYFPTGYTAKDYGIEDEDTHITKKRSNNDDDSSIKRKKKKEEKKSKDKKRKHEKK